MNRYDLATLIVDRLTPDLDDLQRQFAESKTVPSCYIDGLLPETFCRQLFQAFPPKRDMMLKKSLRENKYVAAQMNKYDPLLEEAIFAFQDQHVSGQQPLCRRDQLDGGRELSEPASRQLARLKTGNGIAW